jgi:hypothetical protein
MNGAAIHNRNVRAGSFSYEQRNDPMLVSEKAAGAPTPTAKLNNFNTPKGVMRLTTAVHPYMKTRAFARLSR